MDRVVSLLPSATEIACALGFGERLVGRSHACDFPATVRALPALTGPKLDLGGSSAEIDAAVRGLVRDGLSVYRVDAERLRELAPDVILTQDQCEVCAASLSDVEDALARWQGGAPQVVSLDPRTLRDVFRDFSRIAAALGEPERGRALADALSQRVSDLGERAAGLATQPSVAAIEWIDPLMTAGHWLPELIALAGGRALFGEPSRPSVGARWDAIRAADPDVLVVLPCGLDLVRTRAELAPLLAQPGFAALRAVRERRAFLVDGNQYMNRPGPRLVESLEILCELLHPEAFAPTYERSGWERL